MLYWSTWLVHHDCLPQSTKQNCYSIYQFPYRGNNVICPSESRCSAVLVFMSAAQLFAAVEPSVCGHRDQQRGSWDWHMTLLCVQKTRRTRGEHEQDNVSSPMFKDCRIWVWRQIMNDRTTDAIIQDSNETFNSFVISLKETDKIWTRK